MGARARAELIADSGAAAAGPEFFRSPQFLAAEGVTHTLRVVAGRRVARIPLIVRDVEGSELRDAVSPYGYPGGAVGADDGANAPGAGATSDDGPSDLAPAAIDWGETGLVTLFVRERAGGAAALAGARERSRLQIHDPARPRRVRRRLAEQIRFNEREGWEVGRTRGPDAGEAELGGFHALYTETMRRTAAPARYSFSASYLRQVLGFERSWLLLARRGSTGPQSHPQAGAIVAISDGVLHYYLGGTADVALAASPFKNVVAAMLALADELALPLNLGGGVRPGDGLESFKRGFANAELPYRTHEIVCAQPEYERLCAGATETGFFPAYRAP